MVPGSATNQSVSSKSSPSGRPRFVSTKEAAEYVPYSADYISRLAREGKVAAERTTKGWQVSLEALKLFMLEQQAEQRARREELRESRLREYAKKETERSKREQLEAVASEWLPASLLTTAVALCLLLVGTLGTTIVREELYVAQLWSGTQTVGDLVNGMVPARTQTEISDERIPATNVRIVDGVLIAGEGSAVQDVVSDPAMVSLESATSAVLTPVFADEWSSAYTVTITPVATNTTP